MNSSNPETSPMDESRFEKILKAYGTDFSRWPDSERQPALLFLQKNPQLRDMFEEELALDSLLELNSVASANLIELESRIFEQTIYRDDLIDKILRWFAPEKSPWRQALIACLPVLIGLTIGSNIEVEDQFTLSEEMEFVSFDTTYSILSEDSLDEL